MQIINKKNFIPIVCCVYTIISLGKLIFEAIIKKNDPFYFQNFISILVISFVATAVLAVHYYLLEYPLPLVILGQYFVLIGLIFLAIWIGGHITDISPSAYHDMFWSFTIPYVFLATIYYLNFYAEVKKANHILNEIKEKKNKND